MGIESPFFKVFPQEETLTFDGGLDTKFERVLLPNNESPDCLNVEFINGSVTTRQGTVKLNTNAAGNVAFDGLYTRRSNDGISESMCAFIGGHMLVLGATTFNTVPSAQSVFTIGSRVGVDFQEGYMFIGNGSNGPYKYNGTEFTQHGISAPVATATAVSATTGSLTTSGSYTYVYTHVNSGLVESSWSPVSTTFTVSSAGLAISVSNIAVGSAPSNGVLQRYLYRSTAANTSISGTSISLYYRVAKLTDNTTTSYLDTMSDANLLLQSPIHSPGTMNTPPKYSVICYHRGILFVNDTSTGNQNVVWYSNAGNPYSFDNFFKIADGTTDLVKGFSSYDSYIVIFCENSTHICTMPNPKDADTWRQIRADSPYGSRSPYALPQCEVSNRAGVLHPAVQNRKFVGFALLSGSSLDAGVSFQDITTVGSDLQSQVVEPDMFKVSYSKLGNMSAISYKNRAFISLNFDDGTGNTYNNRVYVWDYSLSNLKKSQIASWVPWSGSGMNVAQFCIYSGSLYGASSTNNGFVYQLTDTGVYHDVDSSTAINSYWSSKEFTGYPQDQAITKDFRYLNIMYNTYQRTYQGIYEFMNITYKTDSDTGTGTQYQLDLSVDTANWGSGQNGLSWGDIWGGTSSQKELRIYLGKSLGKRLQFTFSNQNLPDQKFKVYRAQIAYNIRGYR